MANNWNCKRIILLAGFYLLAEVEGIQNFSDPAVLDRWRVRHRYTGTGSFAFDEHRLSESNQTTNVLFRCVLDFDTSVFFQRKTAASALFTSVATMKYVGMGVVSNVSDRSRFSVLSHVRPYGAVSQINLLGVRPADAGVYRCLWDTPSPYQFSWTEEIILVSNFRCTPLHRRDILATPHTRLRWRVQFRVNAGAWTPKPNTTLLSGGFNSATNPQESRRIQSTADGATQAGEVSYLVTYLVPPRNASMALTIPYRPFLFVFGVKWDPNINSFGRTFHPVHETSLPECRVRVMACRVRGCARCSNLGHACMRCDRVRGYFKRNHKCYQQACESNPCANNGTCGGTGRLHRCTCTARYSGAFCEIDLNPCASHPCQNSGKCVSRLREYTCDCRIGTSGVLCQHVCVGNCISCDDNIRKCDRRRCNSGYGRNATDGACVACYINCLSCDVSLPMCDYKQCRPSTGYDFVERTCSPCMDVHCGSCDEDYSTCDPGRCLDNYGNQNRKNVCTKCVDNCIACEDDPTRCDPNMCQVTYGLHHGSGICYRCQAPQCIRCDGDVTVCVYCSAGFQVALFSKLCERTDGRPFVEAPDLQYFRDCIDNCARCDMNFSRCLQCDPTYGYDATHNACVECKSLRCLKCDLGSTVCDPGCCMRGYGVDPVDGNCQACSPNCDQCNIDVTRCDTGWCSPGFIINPFTRLCEECITGCLACTMNKTTSCDTNQCAPFFRYNSSDSACYVCPSHCAVCEQDLRRCDPGMCQTTHDYDKQSGLCFAKKSKQVKDTAKFLALFSLIGMLVSLGFLSLGAISVVIREHVNPPTVTSLPERRPPRHQRSGRHFSRRNRSHGDLSSVLSMDIERDAEGDVVSRKTRSINKKSVTWSDAISYQGMNNIPLLHNHPDEEGE